MARLIVAGGLRVLADDLTGALDSAAAFGAGVPVHLGRPPARSARAAAVEVLATATRDVPPATLPALLAPAIAWLAEGAAAGGQAFKKVDSLLRGNSFDEVDRVARGGGFDRVLFAPAFPQQRRRTRAGWQWVDPAPGEAAPRPVGEGSIAEAMQRRGWRTEVGERPPDALGASDDTSAAIRPVAWVPDARDDAELLQRVVQVQAHRRARPDERWLWVGSAGLAQALVAAGAVADGGRRLEGDPVADFAEGDSVGALDHPRGGAGPGALPGPAGRRTWLVSASWHPVSRRQWAHLAQVWPLAPTVRGGDLSALRALLQRLDEGEPPARRPLLLDLAATRSLPAEEAAARLAAQVDVLAQAGVSPRTLVVVGGDTLLALCRASDAQGLCSAVALDRPGWGSATLRGGRWHGVRCHTRSGAFGGDDDLDRVLSLLG